MNAELEITASQPMRVILSPGGWICEPASQGGGQKFNLQTNMSFWKRDILHSTTQTGLLVSLRHRELPRRPVYPVEQNLLRSSFTKFVLNRHISEPKWITMSNRNTDSAENKVKPAYREWFIHPPGDTLTNRLLLASTPLNVHLAVSS